MSPTPPLSAATLPPNLPRRGPLRHRGVPPPLPCWLAFSLSLSRQPHTPRRRASSRGPPPRFLSPKPSFCRSLPELPGLPSPPQHAPEAPAPCRPRGEREREGGRGDDGRGTKRGGQVWSPAPASPRPPASFQAPARPNGAPGLSSGLALGRLSLAGGRARERAPGAGAARRARVPAGRPENSPGPGRPGPAPRPAYPAADGAWPGRPACPSRSCFSIFLPASRCAFSSLRWSSVLLFSRQPMAAAAAGPGAGGPSRGAERAGARRAGGRARTRLLGEGARGEGGRWCRCARAERAAPSPSSLSPGSDGRRGARRT